MRDYEIDGFCLGFDYDALMRSLSFHNGDEDLYSVYVENITNSLNIFADTIGTLGVTNYNCLTAAIDGINNALQTGLKIDYSNLSDTYTDFIEVLKALPYPERASGSTHTNNNGESQHKNKFKPLLEKTVNLLPSTKDEKDTFLSKIIRDFNTQPLAILIMLLTMILSLLSSAQNTEINVNINADTVIIIQSVQKELEDSISELLQNIDATSKAD